MKTTALASLLLLAGCTANVNEAEAPTVKPDVVAPRSLGAADARYKIPLDGLPALGGAHPLVTAVVFTDYGCPVCTGSVTALADVQKRLGEDVRVAVLHRPLVLHKLGRFATLVALAADAQGKFAAVHTRLLALEGKLDKTSILAAAERAGVDMTRLEAEVATDGNINRARVMEALAERFGVHAVPTIVLNGKVVADSTANGIQKAFDAELATARGLVATGVSRDQIYAKLVAGGQEGALVRPSVAGAKTNPIATHRAQLAKCWNQVSSAYPPGERTELTLAISIRADGTLAKIDASPAGTPIATCVEKLPHTWSYEPTGEDYTVKMTMGFNHDT